MGGGAADLHCPHNTNMLRRIMASPNTLRLMAEKNKVQSRRYMAWVSVVVDPVAKTQTKGKTFMKVKDESEENPS